MDARTVPMARTREPASQPDLDALKARQRAAWSSGDYAIVGTTLQIVGEELCEALDVRAGQRVLDVAAGNGNVSLAAARRWCEVVASDYVPELLERARERAAAERLDDHVPRGRRGGAAVPGLELRRRRVDVRGDVHPRPGDGGERDDPRREIAAGRSGSPTGPPKASSGRSSRPSVATSRRLPARRSPALWGTRARISRAVRNRMRPRSRTAQRHFVFRYRSPAHWLEVFRTYYGPLLKAFAALEPASRAALERDLLALIDRFNRARRRLHGRARRVPRGRDHPTTDERGLEPTGKEAAMNHAGRSLRVIRITAVALSLGVTLAFAPSPGAGDIHHTVVTADAVKWGPAPPSLPPGAQAAVLLGSPAKEGPVRAPAEVPRRLRRAAAPPLEGRAPHRDRGRLRSGGGREAGSAR